MSTLRDFGILQGAVNKRLAPVYLPIEAFAYIALYLRQGQPSGERLINHPEWRLFFLSPPAVERFFVEAHQYHLLEYHAAGSIIRISFPTTSWRNMPMLSFKDRLELLEQDLKSTPPAFTMSPDLPFAIFRYDPTHPDEGEWKVRREINLLATRVQNMSGKKRPPAVAGELGTGRASRS